MRFAIYSLAAILIAGLAVGIAFSYTPVAEVKRVTPDRGTVYVDPVALMKLHPSWSALSVMRTTLADMCAVEDGGLASVSDVRVTRIPTSYLRGSDSGRRERLREESVKDAVGALSQLEMERRQALQSRVSTMRADMAKEEERKLKLSTQDVEAEVSEQLRVVATNDEYESINARLKLSALKNARKTKGLDVKRIDPLIDAAQGELDKINRIRAAESNEVLAQAALSIDKMTSEAESKISATLDIYERGESRQIEEQIAQARDEIISELDSYMVGGSSGKASVSAKRSGIRSTTVASVVGDTSRARVGGDAAVLKREISQLEAQIRSEVVRAARVIADEKGLNVVFTGGRGNEDRTDDFAKELRRVGWGSYNPVMQNALGS